VALAEHNLGSNVLWSTAHGPSSGASSRGQRVVSESYTHTRATLVLVDHIFREPEIRQLDVSLVIDQEVLGLEVTMHNIVPIGTSGRSTDNARVNNTQLLDAPG